MALLIDTDHLPAMLTVGEMTDEEFARMCGEHSDLSFELTADGELIVMPPNYSITGNEISALVCSCCSGPMLMGAASPAIPQPASGWRMVRADHRMRHGLSTSEWTNCRRKIRNDSGSCVPNL